MQKDMLSKEEALEAINTIRNDIPKQSTNKSEKRKKEFSEHLVIYLIVIAGLWILNLWTSPNFFWAIFPTFGWGIGIVSHYMKSHR